jgi:hypothetical protein
LTSSAAGVHDRHGRCPGGFISNFIVGSPRKETGMKLKVRIVRKPPSTDQNKIAIVGFT